MVLAYESYDMIKNQIRCQNKKGFLLRNMLNSNKFCDKVEIFDFGKLSQSDR